VPLEPGSCPSPAARLRAPPRPSACRAQPPAWPPDGHPERPARRRPGRPPRPRPWPVPGRLAATEKSCRARLGAAPAGAGCEAFRLRPGAVSAHAASRAQHRSSVPCAPWVVLCAPWGRQLRALRSRAAARTPAAALVENRVFQPANARSRQPPWAGWKPRSEAPELRRPELRDPEKSAAKAPGLARRPSIADPACSYYAASCGLASTYAYRAYNTICLP